MDPIKAQFIRENDFGTNYVGRLHERQLHKASLMAALFIGVTPLTASMLDATDWAQIVSAIATVALAVWAVVTALANRAAVQEMRESRLAAERPYVVVDLDYETRHPFVDVVVRNEGPRAAKNIEFSFSDPLFNYKGLNVSSEVGYFSHGLAVLAPGAQVPFTIGNRQHAVEIFRSHGLDQQGITVTVTYQSLDGKALKDDWNINPARFAGRQLVHPTPALDELEKIAVNLDNIAYVLALETRRRSWRRILNLKAYDPASFNDMSFRRRWQRPLRKALTILRIPTDAGGTNPDLSPNRRRPWWRRVFGEG